jgi:hypothetical protein
MGAHLDSKMSRAAVMQKEMVTQHRKWDLLQQLRQKLPEEKSNSFVR